MSAPDQPDPLPERGELIARWEVLMGNPPPPGFSATRLFRGIRYAEQVAADPALQRLDRQANRRLRQLARQTYSRTRPTRKKLMPGTRLLREWRGTTHEVRVTDQGYVFRGTPYRSLSAIAGVITGTRWSGPKFFGIK